MVNLIKTACSEGFIIKTELFSFYVTGLSHEGRQKQFNKLINDLIKREYYYTYFEDLKGKELKEELEYNDKIYKLNDEVVPGVLLSLERDNEYDKNAIAIWIKNEIAEFKLGYVPAKINKRIHKLIEDNIDFEYVSYLKGGDYKYLDSFEEKIITKKSDYKLYITIELDI